MINQNLCHTLVAKLEIQILMYCALRLNSKRANKSAGVLNLYPQPFTFKVIIVNRSVDKMRFRGNLNHVCTSQVKILKRSMGKMRLRRN